MVLRWITFAGAQVLGALILVIAAGWWAPDTQIGWFCLIGMLMGVWAWWFAMTGQSLKYLRWMREQDPRLDQVRASPWQDMARHLTRWQRQYERSLADSRAQLQEFLSAIQASPNGVVLLDAQGRIEWVNQTAASHLGLDPRRDAGQLIGNLLRDPGFAVYQAQTQFDQELVIPGPGSTPSQLQRLSVQLHPYGAGRRLLLSRDVTQLEQAEAMRRDFVANVSHEIRTPLTVLAGFVETLQTLNLTDQERSHYLDLMAQQAKRMQSLVSDLLTLTRLEGSPLPSLNDKASVADMMSHCQTEATTLSTLLTAGQGHRLDFDWSEANALMLQGARSELQSAFSNLICNAVRYTPAGGRIHVTWRLIHEDTQITAAEFAVTDSGPGIAAEHLPRLTERFYRVDRSRSRETGGTGLGLAIVKHVVQRHGASLRIESQPGQGSTFAIRFPSATFGPV
jgi:two-component system, OmpR family, phosphate regulon sensor histidine kinase PhoR